MEAHQQSAGEKLRKICSTYGPLCVGIDPHSYLLSQWSLPDNPAGLYDFSMRIMDVVEQHNVGIIKPQSAFFERHASAGIAVLEKLLARARDSHVISILDAKRGDIGSTMSGYAQAYLDPSSPLSCDWLTLSPYLGPASLEPAVSLAQEHGKGVFILCLTSNPEGAGVQHACDNHGRTVAQQVYDYACQSHDSSHQWASVGLVIGATVGHEAVKYGCDVSDCYAPLLVPGVGAQGACVEDLYDIFGTGTQRVIVNISRALSERGPSHDEMGQVVQRYQSALRDVVEHL